MCLAFTMQVAHGETCLLQCMLLAGMGHLTCRLCCSACLVQAVLLSKGRMMYSGMRDGMVPWFVDHCHYTYDPGMHGLASDWVMDLVNVGFTKPEVSIAVSAGAALCGYSLLAVCLHADASCCYTRVLPNDLNLDGGGLGFCVSLHDLRSRCLAR